ncbi:hypothetical protein BP5796_04224 [Coleophoma crateriformis]|uniref:DOC domain-containing protein n=1 Tax=Coleophoma crateriformis TaxID=565419 RepID=A0A3D8SHT1_9HELO|nr:hypothetical protein BP5796_04224 [Coleophoma crateriformis]
MTPSPLPPSPRTARRLYENARRARHRGQYDSSSSRNITPVSAPVNGSDDTDEEVEEDDDLADGDDEDDLDGGEEEEEEGADVEDIDDEQGEEEGGIEEVPMEIDPPFDPTALGLKEIGNLASWTVSSCKPGCGVEALRDDNTDLFWQSDGPQPHHLNIHFSRLVSIVSIRIFLDFEADESYTPTRITLLAGTGYHDLLPFSVLEFSQPKGWIDVPLDHVGGGEDGNTLRAFLVQVKVVENHQNGKDTHVRGLKVYAKDEKLGRNGFITTKSYDMDEPPEFPRKPRAVERDWLIEPDWMGEPELR